MKLKDRVVLVTGGAKGIGGATILEFARSGVAAVAINYRSSQREAEALADEVRGMGCEARCIRGDVKNDAQVREVVAEVEHSFGRLDVLINNAGTTHWVPFSDLEGLTDEMWDDILDVNLKGSFRCSRAAAPMLARSEGMIINIASTSGILAASTSSCIAYGASKAALMYLTRALAVALAPKVRVNAVAPAFIDTKWMQDHFGEKYSEVVARASQSYPMGRIGQPQEVAAAVVGLVTGGDFTTGQTLVVDGGLTLS